jgi:actin-related protein 10
MLQGFRRTFAQELLKQFDHEPKLLQEIYFSGDLFPANTLSWIGGSLIGSLKVELKEMTLGDTLNDWSLPPWVDR